MPTSTQNREYKNFDRTMRDLMTVPHQAIQEAVEAEKAAKKTKRKAKKKPCAGHRDADKTD